MQAVILAAGMGSRLNAMTGGGSKALVEIGGRPLLLHTLVPNYEVAPAFQAVNVETRDGRSIAGWVASETETAVTLRTAFGTEELVARSNLASLAATGVSLMPDGLEQAMTRAELANLIAFLRSED